MDGGLKTVDISQKVFKFSMFSIKTLSDETFHEWRLVPLNLNQSFGSSF